MIQEKFLSVKEKVVRLRRVVTNMTVKKETTEDKGDKTPFFFFKNYIMSVKYQKIKTMMENYLNVIKKNEIETMYGSDTKVKIHNIGFSVKGNAIMIEAVIVLGETINEEVLDRRLVDYLIQDMMPYFFPEIQAVKVMTRWDV